MRSFFFTALTLSLFGLVSSESFTVMVGKNNGLTYDPPSVTAKKGDTIVFQFLSKNHTVTQSSFVKPCQPLTIPTFGIDSGYFFVPPDAGTTSKPFPEWSVTLNDDSSPLWFYCAQANHCQQGMVFALNPTAEKTFNAFKATAMGSSSTTTPPSNGNNTINTSTSTVVIRVSSTTTSSITQVQGGSGSTNSNNGPETASFPTSFPGTNTINTNNAIATPSIRIGVSTGTSGAQTEISTGTPVIGGFSTNIGNNPGPGATFNFGSQASNAPAVTGTGTVATNDGRLGINRNVGGVGSMTVMIGFSFVVGFLV